MIRKPPSKAQQREELERQMREFLSSGHAVQEIPRGVSSRDTAEGPLPRERWQMDNTKSEWTYIPEVVEALEKRKLEGQKKPRPPGSKKRPRKRLIYDDFGEPLRWVWVDE